MKERILLLLTLLLMCVLIPLQKTNAQFFIFEISKISGDNQTDDVAKKLNKNFVIKVTGRNGVALNKFNVRFSISKQPKGANASLNITDTQTDSRGRARTKLTLGTLPGKYKVVASIGIFGAVTFTATAIVLTEPYGVALVGVGDLTQTVTAGVISEDVRYTLRVTNTGTESDTINLTTSGDLSAILSQNSVTLQGSSIADVTLTIPANTLTNLGTYEVTVTATSQGNTTQTDEAIATIIVEVRTSYGVELTAVDSLMQTTATTDTEDITYTLRVTNTGTETDIIKLTTSGDIQSASLSKTSLSLESGASEDVTLIIPFVTARGLTRTRLFRVSVTAKSKADPSETAKVITTTTVEIPTDEVEVKLVGVGSLTQTTATTDTEDITYTLRVTNSGDALDQVHLTVSGDVDTATIEPTAVVLEPETYDDVTLTIPRAALLDAGTYNVTVTASSELDSTITTIVTIKTIITDDTSTPTDPTEPIQPTDPTLSDQATHKVVFSEFMFESVGGENGLPQWIEVYNNSTKEINLRGWKLHWKRLYPLPFEVTTTFKEDFIIPVEQSRLIVTSLGRHSGGAKLSDDAVYQLHHLHAEEFAQNDIENSNRLITRDGFSLKLINPTDVLIDHIGTLTGDKQTWQLHECLIDGVRTSLIRRFDDRVPRSGTERRGWRRAFDAKRLVAGIYYGHSRDLGTPAYRRGKPLPVELSQFSARFVKDEVVINWTTESELNNAGFNVLRSTSRTKNFRPINTKLIQGAGTTGERRTYQFIDATAKPNVAYYYRIVDVDFSGTHRQLTTQQVQGVIAPTGKLITTWSTLKGDR